MNKIIKSSAGGDNLNLVEKKLSFFSDVIQKTVINIQRNKALDILGMGDMANCMNTLTNLSNDIKKIYDDIKNKKVENIIDNLQVINNELSGLLKSYGTDSIDDLLVICFGSNSSIVYSEEEELKYDLLKKYFHQRHLQCLKR